MANASWIPTGRAAMSDLNIYQDNQDEMLIFDSHKSRLYSLETTDKKIIGTNTSQSKSAAIESNHYILFISLLAVLLLLWFYIYPKKVTGRAERSVAFFVIREKEAFPPILHCLRGKIEFCLE